MQIWDEQNGVLDPFRKASPRAGTSTIDPLATAPVPVTPLQNVGLTAGWTPNYKNLILSDPAYLSWKNSANLDVTQAASARKAALSALAMRYGGLGGGFKDAYGDIDQSTLDLAKGNQFSDIARLGRNYEQGVQGVKRSLAARGGLQSGELGYGLDQQNMAKATSEYDMGQQFGNTAQTLVNNYLATEAASRRAEADALRAAEAATYANPANRPAEGTSATLDPDWQRFGFAVYIGPDGKRYRLDESGNPIEYVPPGAPTPPPTEPPPTDTTTTDPPPTADAPVNGTDFIPSSPPPISVQAGNVGSNAFDVIKAAARNAVSATSGSAARAAVQAQAKAAAQARARAAVQAQARAAAQAVAARAAQRVPRGMF